MHVDPQEPEVSWEVLSAHLEMMMQPLGFSMHPKSSRCVATPQLAPPIAFSRPWHPDMCRSCGHLWAGHKRLSVAN
eukprot:7694182-Karenia_brevis.AAC.1